MKRNLYISAFTFLGILLQFMFHGIIEKWYIGLLVRNFEVYSLGLSWKTWFLIHHAGTFALLAGGIMLGFWQGRFWWRKIYERKD